MDWAPSLDQGEAAQNENLWAGSEKEVAMEKEREEGNISPAQIARERQEKEAKDAKYKKRMVNRAAIKEKRGTEWNTESYQTDEEYKKPNFFIAVEPHQMEILNNFRSNKLKDRLKFKFSSQRNGNGFRPGLRQELENNLELAKKAEEERWLLELGEYRDTIAAKEHLEICIPVRLRVGPAHSICEDCLEDYRRAGEAEKIKQRGLANASY